MVPDCLLGVVSQPTDSRLSETRSGAVYSIGNGRLRSVLAQSARTTSGVAECSFLSSDVYGSNSQTAQYKARIELEPPQVQLIRVEYPKTLLYREDNSFLVSRHYPGGHRTSRG